jgi:hypothetical protein
MPLPRCSAICRSRPSADSHPASLATTVRNKMASHEQADRKRAKVGRH